MRRQHDRAPTSAQARRAPHSWRVTPKQAIALQRTLACRVSCVCEPRRWRFVAGLDAAFSADGLQCIAAAVVWDREERTVVEEQTASRRLTFPYIPGLLSFREAPALLAAIRKLRQVPDVLMCDGQGIAHPRRFGIASHVGVICDLPSIGCAKSRLIGEHETPGLRAGSSVPLFDGMEIIGSVLRLQTGLKPVFVSIGHRIDLPTAEEIVQACATCYRLPEPTRRADRLVAAAKWLRGRSRRTETPVPAPAW